MLLNCFWNTFWFSYFKDVGPTQHKQLRGEEAVTAWRKTLVDDFTNTVEKEQMKLSHQSVKTAQAKICLTCFWSRETHLDSMDPRVRLGIMWFRTFARNT